MQSSHLVAHSGFQKISPADAQLIWHRLHRRFGKRVMAIAIMPDHVHLILVQPAATDHAAFRGIITSSPGRIQFVLPEPTAIPNPSHLARQVRYVHLNPCREGLCGDPLEWPWTTHRDYLGAGIWPDAEINRRLVLMNYPAGPVGRAAFHKYVSGDPSVDPGGTAPPPEFKAPLLLDLSEVVEDAARVLRLPAATFRQNHTVRRLLLEALVNSTNLRHLQAAQAVGVHPSTAGRAKPTAAGKQLLRAIVLTMADPRLKARKVHANLQN